MPSEQPPIDTFVVITIDALRSDRLGLHGYDRPTSPRLDEFAEECYVFDRAFSPGPNTPVAFPALMSSTYPLDLFQGTNPWVLQGRPYVMKALRKAGVRTSFVHCQPMLSPEFGYADDVDELVDIVPREQEYLRKRMHTRIHMQNFSKKLREWLEKLPLWESLWKPAGLHCRDTVNRMMMLLQSHSWDTTAYVQAEQMTDRFIDVFEKTQTYDGPQFFWLHYLDPHGPYAPPREYWDVPAKTCTERALRYVDSNYERWVETPRLDLSRVPLEEINSLYDAEVAYTDNEVGRLLDHLRSTERWDRCAVAITADHGEEFGEHGGMFHHMKLYRELLQVPLLLRVPGAGGTRIGSPVSTLDLCPTVTDCMGLEPDPLWRGESLLRFSEGDDESEDRPVISECRTEASPHVSAMGRHLHAICKGGTEWEAYRRGDPLEKQNAIDELQGDPEMERLKMAVEKRLSEVEEGGDTAFPSVDDDDVQDRLRALGYLE